MANEGKAILYGIRLIRVKKLQPDGSEDTSAQWEKIEGPQEAALEPEYEEGEENTLRGGDKLLATIKDDDVLKALNITLRDARLSAQAVQIIAGGGTVITDGGSGVPIGYEAPKMSDPKFPFEMEIYVANYADGGAGAKVKNFLKFTFKFCEGRLPSITLSDRSFATPEIEIKCTENPAQNAAIFRWEEVEALPAA